MNVLVVGGAGYIGSHCVRQLSAAGHRPVVLDNLVYGHRAAVSPGVPLHVADLGDEGAVGGVLRSEKIDLVMHFAAYCYVGESVTDPLLEDMLLCPLMFYGSASEDDMDLGQFAIMFRALYLEGFARPLDGVRVIMRVILDKYRQAGGERRMKCGVRSIVVRGGRAAALILDSGEEITADHVLSSIGAAETEALVGARPDTGRTLGYVETITVLDRAPAALGWGDDTIVFFNDSERFSYRDPEGQVDTRSGIICFPNNFDYGPGRGLPEGFFRVTCLANYESWAGLPEERYRADKARWFAEIERSARRFLPALDPADSLGRATVATAARLPASTIVTFLLPPLKAQRVRVAGS